MTFEKVIHNNVAPDGTFTDLRPGAVNTQGCVRMGRLDGGGYFVSVFLPLNGTLVEGIKVTFKTKREFDDMLRSNGVIKYL